MDWLHLLLDGYPAATDPSSLSTWRRVETPVMFYGHDTCEDTTSYCSLWARRMGGGYVPKGRGDRQAIWANQADNFVLFWGFVYFPLAVGLL